MDVADGSVLQTFFSRISHNKVWTRENANDRSVSAPFH